MFNITSQIGYEKKRHHRFLLSELSLWKAMWLDQELRQSRCVTYLGYTRFGGEMNRNVQIDGATRGRNNSLRADLTDVISNS
jgi:hypothetical protein